MRAAKSAHPTTVDDYIAGFPNPIREKLSRIRSAIVRAAPGAEESISYRMPAFKLHGALLYFAAFKAHIGMYPLTPGVKKAFQTELARYAQSTGTVRFPIDKPVPYGLIGRIAKFRAKENAARHARKKVKDSAAGMRGRTR